jgi:hypothetical protein
MCYTYIEYNYIEYLRKQELIINFVSKNHGAWSNYQNSKMNLITL